MGSLILTMHTSADGFVATRDGEMWPAFGWPPEAQAHLNDLYREAQAVIYGRHIYELVVPFWTRIAQDGLPAGSSLGETDLEFARIMAPLPKYVVSRGFDPADDATTVIGAEDVGAIAGAADGPVLLLAGGALAGELAQAHVLAELFLLVGPIVLGSGPSAAGRPGADPDPAADRVGDPAELHGHALRDRRRVPDAAIEHEPSVLAEDATVHPTLMRTCVRS